MKFLKMLTLTGLVLFAFACNQAKSIKEEIQELNKDKKDSLAIDYLLNGEASYLANKYEEAIVFLDTAIYYDSLLGTAYYYRALSKAPLEQFQSALNDLEQASKISPKEISIFYYKGLLNLSLKNKDEALRNAYLAIELNPNNSIAYQKGGVIKMMCGKEEEACQDWAKADSMGNKDAVELIEQYCK